MTDRSMMAFQLLGKPYSMKKYPANDRQVSTSSPKDVSAALEKVREGVVRPTLVAYTTLYGIWLGDALRQNLLARARDNGISI
jgi:hypothetical protein